MVKNQNPSQRAIDASAASASALAESIAAVEAITADAVREAQDSFAASSESAAGTANAGSATEHAHHPLRPIDPERAKLWDAVAQVPDPEVPVISIEDLGILRDVKIQDDGDAVIVITPTYSGCPAMDRIASDVTEVAQQAGYHNARVELVLQPAWTTDWMSQAGKDKLEAYGIAPPTGTAAMLSGPVPVRLAVKCPHCDSLNTEETSYFGSTACKALYRCRDCQEPFDHFKIH